MKQSKRVFWILSLMFFMAGCSGYKTACPTETGPGAINSCPLEQGDKARITLVGGNRITGEVMSVSDRILVFKAESDPANPRYIPISEIISVEKENSYTELRIVGLVLALGIIVVSAGILLDNMAQTASISPNWINW